MDTLADAKRIDIISDTHGYLSDELLAALEGADLIIHAGDMTSEADWDHCSYQSRVGQQRLLSRLRTRGAGAQYVYV
mgnify:CR=1 FL=1